MTGLHAIRNAALDGYKLFTRVRPGKRGRDVALCVRLSRA